MGFWHFKKSDSEISIRQMLGWLWVILRGNRLQVTLNSMLGLLSVGVSLLSVWAIQRAIDIASHAANGSLYWAVAVMAMLILCDFAINISRTWIRNILGVKAQNRMQQTMLDRLLRSEWQGRERRHSGDVINRLEMDVSTVVTFITETLPNTLSVVALFIGAFCYLMHMDALLALVTVAILPVFMLLSRLYINRMRKYSRNVRNSDSKVQSILTETVQNRMLVKTLECDRQMVSRLEHTHYELRSNVRRRTKFSVFSRTMLNLGFSAGYIVAFFWSAVRLFEGTITFGAMTAFLQLVYRIQGPARDLTRLAPAFVSVFTAAERLMELDNLPMEEQGEPHVMQSPCGLRLDKVSYAYDDEPDNKVIDNLSFHFPPGSCTAVLGETGVGKTTLVRMLLALIHPQQGSVTIFNKDMCEQVSPLSRCNFVYVPQGNTLLSGSIRDNLLLGDSHATDEMMTEVLRKACADFVLELPEGLDTRISETGGGLSEGQAQRIAIARALLRNRSIMLFDEATSALDPDTERQLLNNLLADNNKTVVFITHRPAVVDYCTQVLRL